MRWDPILKIWTIVSPERGKRPGTFIPPVPDNPPQADGEICPFCHHSEISQGNVIYQAADPEKEYPWFVKVVPNRYPVFRIEGTVKRWNEGLYDIVEGVGAHEIVIDTPTCDLQFADISIKRRAEVLKAYRARILDLKKDVRFRHILIFKNHGSRAGAAMYHSHTQIVALPERPLNLQTMLSTSRDHFNRKERCLFCDVLRQERDGASRVVFEDDVYTAFVPFASSHPFELMVIPRRHAHDFSLSTDEELYSLSRVLGNVLQRLNKTLRNPPYNFVLITAPPQSPKLTRPDYWNSIEQDFHWHIRITPRITFNAGFEWGTGFSINPVRPEDAAAHLRNVRLIPE